MNPVAEIITAAGGFGGLAATITGIATLLAAKRTASQLEPDHGTSVKDQLNRIEKSLDEHGIQLDHQSSQLLQITRPTITPMTVTVRCESGSLPWKQSAQAAASTTRLSESSAS